MFTEDLLSVSFDYEHFRSATIAAKDISYIEIVSNNTIYSIYPQTAIKRNPELLHTPVPICHDAPYYGNMSESRIDCDSFEIIVNSNKYIPDYVIDESYIDPQISAIELTTIIDVQLVFANNQLVFVSIPVHGIPDGKGFERDDWGNMNQRNFNLKNGRKRLLISKDIWNQESEEYISTEKVRRENKAVYNRYFKRKGFYYE